MGRAGGFTRGLVAIALVLAGCTGGDTGDPGPERRAERRQASPSPSPSPSAQPLSTKPVPKDCTWKIGVVAPLTGESAFLGPSVENGTQLAVDVANADPDVPCRLVAVTRDSKGSAQRAAELSALLEYIRVVACVCGTLSGDVLLAGSFLGKKGVLFTGTATHPLTTRRGFPTWFQSMASTKVNAAMAAEYISGALDARNVVFVHDGSRFTKEMARWVSGGIGEAAGKTFRVDGGGSSHAEIAERVAREKPDVVYYGGFTPEAVDLVGDLRHAGYDGTFFGNDAMYSYRYVEAADAAPGSVLTCACVDAVRTPSTEAFAAAYKKRHGKIPPYAAAEVFDVTMRVADALKRLKGKESIREVRRHVVRFFDQAKGLQGITKAYSWNDRGELENPEEHVWVYEWDPDQIGFIPAGTVGDLLTNAAL